MGGFFSSFKSKEAASVMLDFEKAEPTQQEVALHGKMAEVLARAEGVLASISSYEGCQALVQKAISTPTNENMSACWEALKPAVARLRDYYEFTEQIQGAFPELMRALCEDGKLAAMQALSKQLAGLLDFVIRFDHVKLNTPSIQNDFSYYRRSLQRMRANGQQEEGVLSDDLAHKLSMFYASPTPAMSVLVASVTKAVGSHGLTLDSALDSLATLASSARDMLRNRNFSSPQTNLFCLRSMVAAIILFDILDENGGAFCKKSPINVRTCVSVLREWPEAADRVALCNMLRFTSRHLKDDTTVAGLAEAINEAAESGHHNNNN